MTSKPTLVDPYERIVPAIPETEARVGEVVGLAVRGQGNQINAGEILVIQAAATPGPRGLEITGLRGTVLSDSARTAYAYVRDNAEALGLQADFVTSKRLSVHLRRISEFREGPSAGTAIATCMISALSGRPVWRYVAITGELDLSGGVLSVGGVVPKIVAAYRNGCSVVIVPKENQADVANLPNEISERVDVKFVERLEEVLQIALVP